MAITAISLRREKGYSGVGLYTRHKPGARDHGFGNAEFDAEGRYVEVQYPHLAVIGLRAFRLQLEERQQAKFRFMESSCRTCCS
jgi:exodeoxyribonuclease-3